MVMDSNEVRYIVLAASSFLAHLRQLGKEIENIILELSPHDYFKQFKDNYFIRY